MDFELFGIKLTEQEFNNLICEQSNGKELKVVDGKVIAVEHQPTQEELKQRRIYEIQARLNQLTQDFVQADLGAVFDDLEARKIEFKTLHNELRELQGKYKREYIY